MGRSVKRKKLTSDDLMRRLEDPGRQPKRPRLDTNSVDENDGASTGIQESGESDSGENEDEDLELPLGRPRMDSLNPSLNSLDTSEPEVSNETDTKVEPFLSAYTFSCEGIVRLSLFP